MLVMGKPLYLYKPFIVNDNVVAGTSNQKDTVRGLVRSYLSDGVEMLELEYQPNEQ